ncbi:bifunctional NAD(P)H-hydrate repair enzyme Nnr [Flavihumibacter petaseus NBRC 106054]|uniref:Bifunctional NAD(P)H-hydrate repair enzyme n=2 Tax=Flavihumibacter TaxID=1004301 RepID=A0A0E9N6P9_9BACT|nr:bifunctional NAD(P)H-hydrate repair enzyme Nnr [Flavihumibacter petaseus NBRC 106054]
MRDWDAFTISNLPISSIDLMENAARACVTWLEDHEFLYSEKFTIFCGKGNNGGDGLAIARLLGERNKKVQVFILEFGQPGTADFQTNLQRLHGSEVDIQYLQEGGDLPEIFPDSWIIDALLGTGTSRPATGRLEILIDFINRSGCPVCSIDLPSGMPADFSIGPFNSEGQPYFPSVRAKVTLSFQSYKPALLFAENAAYTGLVHLLDIGLSSAFLKSTDPDFEGVDQEMASGIIEPRSPFAHKGNFGHALLIAGSVGKMGAALLAGKACLRAGCGLLTFQSPETERSILQTGLPEAMLLTGHIDANYYRSIGCGPGLGQSAAAATLLEQILNEVKRPMVWDADAINLLAVQTEWQKKIPPFTILTPHPKEFDRLAGISINESERWNSARALAISKQWIIILKGHHTLIAMPGGKAYFNTSGNAAMAKGGSGDVLTGLLTGLIARGYTPEKAALLGVWLHGRAGDFAASEWGMESVLAGDIIDQIGNAFMEISS